MMAIADSDSYTRRTNIVELMIWGLTLFVRAHQIVQVTMESVADYDGWMDHKSINGHDTSLLQPLWGAITTTKLWTRSTSAAFFSCTIQEKHAYIVFYSHNF